MRASYRWRRPYEGLTLRATVALVEAGHKIGCRNLCEAVVWYIMLAVDIVLLAIGVNVERGTGTVDQVLACSRRKGRSSCRRS